MPKLKNKSKELLGSLLLAVIGVIVACGGGGSGAGQAGNQAVLRIVNATQQIDNLGGFIDGQLLFPQILKGQASDFESVQDGTRLIELLDNQNPDLKIQIQNEFAFSIPYSLILMGPDSALKPILAINDRSDTPQTQFRIRAVNASSAANISVKLIPRQVTQRDLLNRAAPTATTQPSSTPPTLTPTVAASSTASLSATPTSTPVASPTSANINLTEVLVGSELNSAALSDYVLVNRGDYQIQVTAPGESSFASGLISYQGGQVETIVVSDSNGSLGIIRLNDKP